MPYSTKLDPASLTFGALLKSLRKAGGMTQRDLAAALGYSDSHISGLEKDQRPPDLDAVMQRFIPALGLQDDPATIARLVDQAAAACGKRPPALIAFQRATQAALQTEHRPAPLSEHAKPLPLPPTALIGRSTTVNQLCNRLLGHDGRLLTLVGPPGIGKTRLALAMASHLQYHYPQGAVVVPLVAISDSTLMAVTILSAVGHSDTSTKPPQTRLIECLRHKTMLMVLDNCEELLSPPLSGVELIAELVAECPGLCILATSRERLHLRVEQRFKVPALDLAAASELFTQRAQVVDADFACTAHNQPILEAICQRLDCLPLALELCAAQIDLLSPAQLLAQLQVRRLDLLVNGAHDLPPRQRTLRAAIGYSYALLNEAERLLFRSLGVFAGGFALKEVETLTAEWLAPVTVRATLHALIGKSLVRAEPLPSGEQRFLLLETIREFALEQAQAHGEEGELRPHHYATYLHLFRTSYRHLRGPAAAPWFARLKPEQDNLRAALQWTLDTERYTDTAWLLLASGRFGHLRGHWDDLGWWLAQLIPHRQSLPTELRLAILCNACNAARYWEAFQPVGRWTGEMMGLLEVCPNKLLQATAWFWFAIHATDFTQAAAAWEQAIEFARATYGEPALGPEFCLLADPDFVLVSCLWDYASALLDRGQVAHAVPLITESLAIFRRRENQYEIADAIGTLGRLALLQGDLTQAHRYLQEAVAIATAFDHQGMLRNWPLWLGLVTLYSGDAKEARRLLRETLRLCIEQQDKVPSERACTYLAETALWDSDLAQSVYWLAQSLTYDADPRKNSIYTVARLWVAARLATAQQQYQRAATLFGLAEQMRGQIHHAIAGPMHALADAALETVQVALEPAVFAEAFARGQQLSLEAAFATILAPAQV